MERSVKNLIIGGGQAGLSASYCLQQLGQENLVIDAAPQPANAWRTDRWDSFTLVTPNWSWKLPGDEYAGDSPGGYMPRAEIVRRFEDYITQNHIPIQYQQKALSIEPDGDSYRVETTGGTWKARNVIVATGVFQAPRVLPVSQAIAEDILQLPSGKYRNPAALPPGAVLVVGSAQSGCQIAEEINQSGRKVYLSIGKAGRVPRRYRGKDIVDWLDRSGFFTQGAENLPSPAARFAGNPHLTGKDGGHTLNLHRFYRDGITLVGRLQGIEGNRLFFAPGLQESIAAVDKFEENLLKMVDSYIAEKEPGTPPETIETLHDAAAAPEIPWLDLKTAGVTTIIWANGYVFDYSLVKAPVFDEFGYPAAEGGVSKQAGLYFVGFGWLPYRKSGLLLGIAESAEHIARHASSR